MKTRTLLILLSVIANMAMVVRAQDKPIAQACQQTAFDLFNKLAEKPEAPDNLCFSPLSAQIALSMVSNGAAGETLREMQETLGTYGYSNNEVNAFYKSLTASITTRPPYDPADWGDEEGIDGYNAAYPVCEIANSVWYRPEISLYESFTDLIKVTYDAGFGSVRFDTEEGIGIINNWVNTKTHGLIPTIYDEPQSPDLAVMLADALYFKGSWKHPFDKKLTKLGVFHLGNGMAVNTDMMATSSDYSLSETGAFRAVTIPYGIGDFSMTLFVPVKGTALPTLTFEDWAVTMSENAKNKPVSLYMPKFSIKGKHDLKPVLQELGMNLPFSMSADFSRMSPDGLFIDKTYQLDNITVDENGTEAAAVTVIEMIKNGVVSDYEEFCVDRPFYFTIENRKEQSILFVGRVTTLEGEAIVEDEFVDKSEEGIDLKFKVISRQDKTVMVTGLSDPDNVSDHAKSLTIPGMVKGFSVVSVGEGAFKDCPFFESVVISEGVKRIEDLAFRNCSQTKKIKLPSTLQWLGTGSFASENLEEVVAMMDNPVELLDDIFDFSIDGTKNRLSKDNGLSTDYKYYGYEYGVYENAVLFVPAGAKELYQSRQPWGLFENIKELNATGVFSLSDACQQTAFTLFNKLTKETDTDGNICFSPLSAQIALSMVQNGAEGNTLNEMHSALGTDSYTDEEVNSFYKSLINTLTTRPKFDPEQWKWWSGESEEDARKRYDAAYPICEIANSVWHRPNVTLYDSFTDILTASYDAGFGAVWFNTEEGIEEINCWVNHKTHGLIPKLYNTPQSDYLAVVLADALYFKGAWKNPFDKELTKPDLFYLADGTTAQTDMMCASDQFASTTGHKFRTITMPYGKGDFSMTLFVPVADTMLPELSYGDWLRTINTENNYHDYSLFLPRFDFSGKYDLIPSLKQMGIEDAFNPFNADFTRMTDNDVVISKVYQLSDISVDEDGTEAAAVTVIEMEDSAMPEPDDYEEFRVDRPFYFTIENRKEQSVLFVGRVSTLSDKPVLRYDGDVNGDNKTDISDVVAIINVMAGNGNFAFEKVDINHDEKVDISDVVAVINIIAGNMSD